MRDNAFDIQIIPVEMTFANMETVIRRLPARTRRQVMDWSLVLASQEIETSIERDDAGWFLTVADVDWKRAADAIELYQLENRRWGWREDLTEGLAFHAAGFWWALFLILVHVFATGPSPRLFDLGIVNSIEVAQGAWWRIFTGMTLHADIAHLTANVTTGFLFFAFAMAHYGPGVTLLISYLAGAAANAAAFAIYPPVHQSLGASGMVMAGLGLLGVHSFAHRHVMQHRRRLWQAMAGTFLILVLFGFSPGTDILAHVGGFVFGALGGIILKIIPAHWQSPASDRSAGWILIGLVAIPWFLALTRVR